jgi:hypothetical protein
VNGQLPTSEGVLPSMLSVVTNLRGITNDDARADEESASDPIRNPEDGNHACRRSA